MLIYILHWVSYLTQDVLTLPGHLYHPLLCRGSCFFVVCSSLCCVLSHDQCLVVYVVYCCLSFGIFLFVNTRRSLNVVVFCIFRLSYIDSNAWDIWTAFLQAEISYNVTGNTLRVEYDKKVNHLKDNRVSMFQLVQTCTDPVMIDNLTYCINPCLKLGYSAVRVSTHRRISRICLIPSINAAYV